MMEDLANQEAASYADLVEEQPRSRTERRDQQIQRILIERGPAIIPYFFAQLGAIRTGWDGFALKPFAGRTDLAAIRPQ